MAERGWHPGNFRCVLSAKFYGRNLKYSSHRLRRSCLDKLACRLFTYLQQRVAREIISALSFVRHENWMKMEMRCVWSGFWEDETRNTFCLCQAFRTQKNTSEFGFSFEDAQGDQLVCLNFHLIILTRLRFLARRSFQWRRTNSAPTLFKIWWCNLRGGPIILLTTLIRGRLGTRNNLHTNHLVQPQDSQECAVLWFSLKRDWLRVYCRVTYSHDNFFFYLF